MRSITTTRMRWTGLIAVAALTACSDSTDRPAVDLGDAAAGRDAEPVDGASPPDALEAPDALSEPAPRSLPGRAYAALSAGDRDSLPDLIEQLDAEAEAKPDEGRIVFYAGMMHLWRLAESEDDPEYDLAARALDSHAALENLKRAHELVPEDLRIPSFIGVTQVATGRYVGSLALIDEGRASLSSSLEGFPAYAHFVRGLALGELATDHPYFAEAVEDLRACVAACDYENDDDALSFVYPEQARSYPHQVCNNDGMVPHVWEGVFLTYGDLLAKVGEADGAVRLYENARSSPTYDRWTLKEVLEDRIRDVDARVALYTDDDLGNDPLTWAGEGRVCTGCHADSASAAP